MGGDNPVFVTDAFNVGLDEYNSAYKEDMTQYTQYVMDLVYNKYGKTPMAWASMGCVDSDKTKIPDYPIMDAWANYAISLKSLFNQDYKLINATNKYGYIVPGGNNGYPDFAKEEEMYNNLSAGKFRDKMGAGVDVAEGHPKLLGVRFHYGMTEESLMGFLFMMFLQEHKVSYQYMLKPFGMVKIMTSHMTNLKLRSIL